MKGARSFVLAFALRAGGMKAAEAGDCRVALSHAGERFRIRAVIRSVGANIRPDRDRATGSAWPDDDGHCCDRASASPVGQ